MDITRLIIEGDDLEPITAAVEEEFVPGYIFSSGDISVFMWDDFNPLGNSYQASGVVLNYKEKGRCEVDAIAANGGGVFFDSDESQNKKMVSFFENLCSKNSWKLTKELEEED